MSRPTDPQGQVSFKVAPHEATLIRKIVRRGLSLAEAAGAPRDKLEMSMDITACHANGNPLDLVKLAAADDFNLAHDVFGIERHLDRNTGKLTNFFSPRCSKREADAAQ